jgi:formylglycine-generating enzyme required for sulfatase activity
MLPPGAWVQIPAGTFQMGSPAAEPCAGITEKRHKVTLTRKFEIQTTEVTQGQFSLVLGYNLSKFSACGSACPAEQVSWHEAAAYCNALSRRAGLAACYSCSGSGKGISCQATSAHQGSKIYGCRGYRLPSEAEWEYAYRAGTTSAFYNGPVKDSSCIGKDSNAASIGWYAQNSGGKTHPSGGKQKNAWGLYDMAGNVKEWCHDPYQEDLGTAAVTDPMPAGASERAARGGAHTDYASHLRAAYRDHQTPSYRLATTGFRCARSL